jgi:hypothetical protein
MPDLPTPKETIAWAYDTAARSKSIRADSARIAESSLTTRAATERLLERARDEYARSADRGNG